MIKSVRFGVLALSLGWGVSAFGDADIAVQEFGVPTEATAHVDLCVVVPEILIFGVGAIDDDIAKVRWTLAAAGGYGPGNNQTYNGPRGVFTAPAPFSNTVVADFPPGSVNGLGAFAADDTASLPVFLFSNNGSDVTITTATSGGATGGGTVDALDHQTLTNTIDIDEFISGQSGSITHPALTTGDSADTAQTGGIVNLVDTWTYQYVPASIPPAGTYEARVTYTAAQP